MVTRMFHKWLNYVIDKPVLCELTLLVAIIVKSTQTMVKDIVNKFKSLFNK